MNKVIEISNLYLYKEAERRIGKKNMKFIEIGKLKNNPEFSREIITLLDYYDQLEVKNSINLVDDFTEF